MVDTIEGILSEMTERGFFLTSLCQYEPMRGSGEIIWSATFRESGDWSTVFAVSNNPLSALKDARDKLLEKSKPKKVSRKRVRVKR